MKKKKQMCFRALASYEYCMLRVTHFSAMVTSFNNQWYGVKAFGLTGIVQFRWTCVFHMDNLASLTKRLSTFTRNVMHALPQVDS